MVRSRKKGGNSGDGGRGLRDESDSGRMRGVRGQGSEEGVRRKATVIGEEIGEG